MKTCKKDCGRKVYKEGYCKPHYNTYMGTMRYLSEACNKTEIELKSKQNRGARYKKLSEQQIYDAINSGEKLGSITEGGYRSLGTRNGRRIPAHRFMVEHKLGRPLLSHPEEMVHHKNGIRDDNRIKNLELCAKFQPPGQRVEDMLEFAFEIIDQYGEEFGYELRRVRPSKLDETEFLFEVLG